MASIFGRFFKPRAKLDIYAPDFGRPGESLPTDVRLQLHQNVEPRAIRLELTAQEKYYVRVTTTDSKGHTQTHIEQRRNTFITVPHALPIESALRPGDERRWRETLQVPPAAPPTSKGDLVDVRWALKAVMDLPHRRDFMDEVPLKVLAPAPPSVANQRAERTETSKSFEECTLYMELEESAMPAEQEFRGSFRIDVSSAFDVQGIRAELVREEDAEAKDKETIVAQQELSGPRSMTPHLPTLVLPLTLLIPLNAPPTVRSPHSSLSWKVRVILARRMRTDFAVQQDVLVCNG